MSARSMGSATVSFGLVSLPVKLYSSSDSSSAVSFNWLHKDCGSRLKQQYICARDGEIVERDDRVKGYEFAKDQYVLFSSDELKALEQESNSTIEIVEFVPGDQVERLYVDRVYYLGPDKGGDRPYRLLGAAMRETGLSALGRYSARGKQYLVLLRPMGDGLAMEQLRYAQEIRPFSEVPLGQGEVKKEELKLAIQLIEQTASDTFRPEGYDDEVRERVLELIQRKIEGQDITDAPAEAPRTQVIDLMAALKASLSAEDGGTAERKPAKRMDRRGKGRPGDADAESKSRPRKAAAGGGQRGRKSG